MAINMSYVRYENTLAALQEVNQTKTSERSLSESESQAKQKLIALMVQMLEDEGYEVR